MADDQRHGLRLLSIDGGGIRGMSSLVILRRLMYRLQQKTKDPIMRLPCDSFDMMAGTGTGGIIVLLLGRLRMSVDETIKAFEQLSKDVFVDGARTGGDSLFQASNLEEAIKQIILSKTGDTETALMDQASSACKTFVAAMNAANMNGNIPVIFRTYNTPEEEPIDCTIWEAARATSATYTLFRHTVIGSQCFVGGDLGKNNPAALLLSETASVFPDRDVACIISIGAGKGETISFLVPSQSQENAVKMAQLIATDCEHTHEALSQRFRDSAQLYFRFNVEQGTQSISITHYEKLPDVEAHTKQYMNEVLIKKRSSDAVNAMQERPCTVPTADLCSIHVPPLARELHDAMKSLQTSMQGVMGDVNRNLSVLNERYSKAVDAEKRKSAFEWLNAPPDPDAFKMGRERYQNTGSWLLDDERFRTWTENGGSSLWIYGKPGSGKTVICSTIMESISNLCRANKWGFAAYFFDFRELNSTLSDFLRSLLKQLSWPISDPRPLMQLYSSHKVGLTKSSNVELTKTLSEAFIAFERTYIIVDALDESGAERREVLDWLFTFIRTIPSTVHFLMSSRREHDIIKHLERHVPQSIDMDNSKVDADMRVFVREKLHHDPVLAQRWSADVLIEIEMAVTKGAGGMFRWVVCQLDALSQCLNERHVRQTLSALPKTLDETYDRLLQQIHESHTESAHKLLSWLCFSTRRLSVAEAAEAIAIDVSDGGDLFLDTAARLQNPTDVLTILSSLLVISRREGPFYVFHKDHTGPFVELAHYSVKEYLLSARVAIPRFRLQTASAHAMIGQSCLAYIFHWSEKAFAGSESLDLDAMKVGLDVLRREYPLMQYAVEVWPDHIWPLNHDLPERLHAQVMSILSPPAFGAMYSLRYLMDRIVYLKRELPHPTVTSPLYFAVFGGVQPLHRAVMDILAAFTVEPLIEYVGEELRPHSGWQSDYRCVWTDAISRGDASRLEFLLCAEAGTSFPTGLFLDVDSARNGAALQFASRCGDNVVVRMLLDAGADVNRVDSAGETALQCASREGHDIVSRMLLDGGANVNAQGSNGVTALQSASYNGNKGVVCMLLDGGANVNAKGSNGEAALQSASGNGHKDVVRMLLDKGANLNAKDSNGVTALQSASSNGLKGVVRVLLDAGAGVNGKDVDTALGEASYGGHESVGRMLLDAGSSVSGKDNYGWAPLRLASHYGREAVVRMLLDASSHVNEKNEDGETALYSASCNGDEAVVRILLDAGSDVNGKNKKGKTALHSASAYGHEAVVRMLLDAGSNVNGKNKDGEIALHLASAYGHKAVVRILLDEFSNVNAKDNSGKTALQLGSGWGRTAVVRMLLDAVANPDEEGYIADDSSGSDFSA